MRPVRDQVIFWLPGSIWRAAAVRGARTSPGEQAGVLPLPTGSFAQLFLTAPSFVSQPPPEKRTCVGLIIPGDLRNSPCEVAHPEDMAISYSAEIPEGGGHGPGSTVGPDHPKLWLSCTDQPLFPQTAFSGKLYGLCSSWSHVRAGVLWRTQTQPWAQLTPGLGWAGLGLAPTYPPVLHAHCQHDDIADVLLPHQPPEVLYGFL